MATQPKIARIWRGRTRTDIADAYEDYIQSEGIPPPEKTALGVQLFREDLPEETRFTGDLLLGRPTVDDCAERSLDLVASHGPTSDQLATTNSLMSFSCGKGCTHRL